MEHARPPPELILEGGPVHRAEAWRRWRQQFELFLKASGAHDDKAHVQASLLVNLIGSEGFDVYQTFSFESEADRDDVKVLLKKFDQKFGTKVNITMLRFKFFMRNQDAGESIQLYVTALRLLSKNCEFGALEESLIKDRIVCGIKSNTVRDRLLRCDDLDLEKAVKMCQADEASQESGRALADCGESSVAGVSMVQVDAVGQQQRGQGSRGRCGSSGGGGGARRGGGARAQPVRQPSGCVGCGGRCQRGQCPARHVLCFVCGKGGHFARVCKSNSFHNNNSEVRRVYEIERDSESEGESFFISVINNPSDKSDKWYESLHCDNGSEKFKLDTGADINVLSLENYLRLGFDIHCIKQSKIKLQSYSGDFIPVKGTCNMPWMYKNLIYELTFAIADMKCQSVLGRKSCEALGLIQRIHSINIAQYDDLFKGLGCLPGKYHIVVDESVQPVVCASRKIPLGMRDRLAGELKKMEELGVIRKVSHPTNWVHPLVLVAKKNNGLRVCLDPRELNRAVKRAHFQLPTVTELAARLQGARYFSVLDANSGFWAIQLDEASADLCTFATPFGRYQFLRLPFGINCASEVFHAKIRQLLEDLEGTDSFVDDVIVWGRTKQEHDIRLQTLLARARDINLKFNREKCRIGLQEVTYLGHVFDAHGMRPDNNKVKAIVEMPEPKERKSLERFLGAVNYLSKFIPNYSELALPLTSLLRKDRAWQWDESEQRACTALKTAVASAPVLALWDPSRPALLSVDASRDALGAVLMQDGRPIEYASRTLTDAQRRYAQVEKELLAIVFACERFHQYIFGKEQVVVESDHKPLESIFKKPLMSVPARLQRMMLRIQGYDLLVGYKPGKYMYIPDALSRAPLPELYSEEVQENVLCQVQMVISNIPISNKKLAIIKRETGKDAEMCKLREYIMNGWPDHKYNVVEQLKVYWSIKDELYTVDGVIFKDALVLIPPTLREQMLQVVHEGHQGIDRCKRRARQVIFWPNITRDIEHYVRRCNVCRENSNASAKEPMIPIPIPTLPWSKVGTDLFEYQRKHFLLIVDYYSNFVEVIKLTSTTSAKIIEGLKEVFSRHGIPEVVISDNGPQYSSREFRAFATEWDFDNITSSPNYPQANGKSERAVQAIKALLTKAIHSGQDFYVALLNYRNTPRDGLSSPAQLLMSRRLRCKLPVCDELLQPRPVDNAKEHATMVDRQLSAKRNYDKRCKALPTLGLGDKVICKDGKQKIRGTVVAAAPTPRSYIVENSAGVRYRRNRRHLIKTEPEEEASGSGTAQKGNEDESVKDENGGSGVEQSPCESNDEIDEESDVENAGETDYESFDEGEVTEHSASVETSESLLSHAKSDKPPLPTDTPRKMVLRPRNRP